MSRDIKAFFRAARAGGPRPPAESVVQEAVRAGREIRRRRLLIGAIWWTAAAVLAVVVLTLL